MIILLIVSTAALGIGLLIGSILPSLRGPGYTGPECEQIAGVACLIVSLVGCIIYAVV
jgi:hypothetical protein